MAKRPKSIIFRHAVKHGRHHFLPGVPLAFEDADAAPYFIGAGWADESDQEPVHTYPAGEVDIDPDTVFADGPNKGRKVMEVARG